MTKRYSRYLYVFITLALLAILVLGFFMYGYGKDPMAFYLAGGYITEREDFGLGIEAATQQDAYDYSERFQRPSKLRAYPNPYADISPDKVPVQFTGPDEAVLAYYAILKEASNMEGYTGGCGTVGQAAYPYAYAYQLLSDGYRQAQPLSAFTDSFQGIGHITLLNLATLHESEENAVLFAELEFITGLKEGGEETENGAQTQFHYYYAVVDLINETGWQIENIRYYAEDFLCAPYHGWSYDAQAVVDIVYRENLQLVDRIAEVKKTAGRIYVYAEGSGQTYRFAFIRLTNGYDILAHEYIYDNGAWREVQLLSGEWENLKLTGE